nr:response regulator [Paenibacillus turpanensis]
MKVFIIDDEILAIQHLKALIDWDEHGFEVVGETVHPRKGLELAAALNPDVMFVDIRMPVMDGLEFSEKLLEAGCKAKIVVLTSYKEFDYVKRSLKLGVFDYLVKHELTPESLSQELRRIREEIMQERTVQKKLSKPILTGIVEGKQPSGDDLKTLTIHLSQYGSQYFFIAVEADVGFPVLGERSNQNIDAERVSELRGIQVPKPLYIAETFPLGGQRLGILLISSGISSQLQVNEMLFHASYVLKQSFREQQGCGTVSAAFSAPFTDICQLGKAAEQTQKLLSMRIFHGPDRVWGYYEEGIRPKAAAEAAAQQIEQYIRGVKDCIGSIQLGKLEEQLRLLFNSVKTSMQPDSLQNVCKLLTDELEKLRSNKGLPSVKEGTNEKAVETEHWKTIQGISQWFTGEFKALLEGDGAETCGYSPKVRKAIQYMQQHFAEEITIEQIAEHLHISGDHLRHCFKNDTGRTVLDYLTDLRIDKAKQLLSKGNYKLYEVAEKVGYRSSHYFSKVFQRATGLHPLAYSERKHS